MEMQTNEKGIASAEETYRRIQQLLGGDTVSQSSSAAQQVSMYSFLYSVFCSFSFIESFGNAIVNVSIRLK
jgi:predicted Zn-dependent peptidase